MANSLSVEDLYSTYKSQLVRYFLSRGCSIEVAEDTVQSAFVKVISALDGFRGEAQISSWLHKIAIREFLMKRRGRRFTHEIVSEEAVSIEGSYAPAGLSELIVSDLINRLAPGYKKIFLMHEVEGYEHEEIAEKLGINTGTVKSQLFKAKRRLRKLAESREAIFTDQKP